jgi:predicted nucleic acid-binding protein
MPAPPFLDSNILIYAYSDDVRSTSAQLLCERPHTLSVQSLNEFANIARRKLHFDWDIITAALIDVVTLADRMVPLTFELHEQGVVVARRYRLQVYDAMIVAAALQADCEILYSEDMHHGLVIEERLTIRNPFV